MSGGCEVKTCWLAAPSIRTIGDTLKEKYRQVVKVQVCCLCVYIIDIYVMYLVHLAGCERAVSGV
jgi:hypothetical protein